MKLITAIVSKKDVNSICNSLRDNGFFFTKISTTGGFLKVGNVTLIIGLEDEKLQPAIDIIKTHSVKRKQVLPITPMTESNSASFGSQPLEIEVGGATIFVTNVEHFEKV